MSIFSKIFNLFDRNKPHKDLIKEYSALNRLAVVISRNIKELRLIQNKLVRLNISAANFRGATGGVGLEKTLFVEEELIKELKKLAKQSEERFFEIEEEIKFSEPFSPLEKDELIRIINFLDKINKKLPNLEKLASIRNNKEKLNVVESSLRNVTKLAYDFYKIRKYELSLAREVRENEISHLLKKIYDSPQRLLQDPSILIFPVTKRQLRSLEKESEKINACRDMNYKIEWRRWWRDLQIPERDQKTALKDPHINVTIKLFGRSKKDIHLVLKAA